MDILVTGGTGFIGSGLVEQLADNGHRILVVSRSTTAGPPGVEYVSSVGDVPLDRDFDAFINLAGESIAASKWSESRRQVLFSSRVALTGQLFELAERLPRAPRVLLNASAIGFYGSHDDTPLDEEAGFNECFSHRLCDSWEQEAARFEPLGTRVCRLRIGIVLGAGGGALTELSRSNAVGISGWMGSGSQYMSWVHLEDVHRAMHFLLEKDALSGAVNLTAPEPQTAREFARVLASVRGLPLQLPVPGFMVRLLFGEMGRELLLEGQRVIPAKLQQAGFRFRYPGLSEALADIFRA